MTDRHEIDASQEEIDVSQCSGSEPCHRARTRPDVVIHCEKHFLEATLHLSPDVDVEAS